MIARNRSQSLMNERSESVAKQFYKVNENIFKILKNFKTFLDQF